MADLTKKEAQAIRYRRWCERHPERLKAKAKKQYWDKREQNLARSAAWAKENPIANREKVRRYALRHPELVAARSKVSKNKYYEENKERLKKYIRAWQVANPEKRAAHKATFYVENSAKIAINNRKYCVSRDTATPAWANEFFMNEAYRLARLRTKVLGRKWVVDHIVPLNSKIVCGLHAHTNLQVIPQRTNAIKSNRWWPDMPEALHGN